VKPFARVLAALFRGSEEGQSLVEYLIILGACALVGIAGFSRYGQVVKKDLGANAKHIEGEGLPTTEGLLGSLGADYNELPGWCVKPNYCFGGGTPVETETGDRPIESVRIGDRVWARDMRTGAVALRPVLSTYRTPHVPVIDLELSASHGASELIAVTHAHLFWVEDKGWVRADALAAEPLWSTEARLSANLLREEPAPTTVYNLEVSEFHSYFVGHGHVLVHNGDPESCADAGPASAPQPSPLCPAATPYKSPDNLCCEDQQLQKCKCAAQINKKGHELTATYQVNGSQIDIRSKPGTCSSKKDSCSGEDVTVDVEDQTIKNELQKKAFTSMCGGSSKPIVPGAFLAAQESKPSWNSLSTNAQQYYIAFDKYCTVLSGKLNGQIGNTAALHLGDDPDVKNAEAALLELYNGLSGPEKKQSNQITTAGSNAYHTEPKAIAFLEDWQAKGDQSLKGGTMTITGTASPCAKCDKDLTAFAKKYQATVKYCFDAIYPSGPARTNSAFFAPDAQIGNCSIAYKGCIEYSKTGAVSYETQPGQEPLCDKGADSCPGN